MDAREQNRTRRAYPDGATADDRLPMCYFCSSTDTMEPFDRSDHLPVVSSVFPRLRVRFCRSCTRHFLAVLPGPP
jgi:hypothetical protein